MSKKLLFAMVAFASTSMIDAKQTSYSQNNLPRQNEQNKMEYPIIINADLLFGRIISNATIPLAIIDNNVVTGIRAPNKNKLGFRAGFGISVKNKFNISGQYTYMHSGDKDRVNIPSGTFQVFALSPITAPGIVDIRDKQFMQWADLLVQTASWMLSSNLRIQPFGGVRYFYWKRDLQAQILEPVQNAITVSLREKIHATGPMIGTDLKYLLSRWVHFFSNFNVGALAGFHSVYAANAIFADNAFSLRPALDFAPWTSFSFGFGSEFRLGNCVLMSLRVFYEIFQMRQNVLPTLAVTGDFNQGSSGNGLLFASNIIKTQMFGFGVTADF